MSNKYYTRFGIEGSGELNFVIRCNLSMKELSYIFKNYKGEEFDYIAIQLTYDGMEAIKPYIMVKDFEKYRYKPIEERHPLHSYLDGWTMNFEGVTDSEIPIIQLSSDDYDCDIQPPVEKLYSFLENEYFGKNKKYKSYYGK